VHRALKQLHRMAPPAPQNTDWQISQSIQAEGKSLEQPTRATLLAALAQLAAVAPDEARLLCDRYERNQTATAVSLRMGISEAELYRRQQHAIDLLTALVRGEEGTQRAQVQAQALARLEASTYNHLIGVDEHLARLQRLLEDPHGSPLICVTGLGGIGKTALVDNLMRRMVMQNRVQGLAWITARQQSYGLDGAIVATHLPVLSGTRLLQALWDQLLPHLPAPLHPDGPPLGELELQLRELPERIVVIDNLETAADLAGLMPLLRRLAQPVKFVLTSREQMLASGTLYQYPLTSLSREHALALLRSEAQVQNLPALVEASEDQLSRIYEVAGGHPLALRLIVGQLHRNALPDVLRSMQQVNSASSENLYAYIYEQSWLQLDATARSVLLAMPQAAASGATCDFVAAITGLPPAQVQEGMAQLVKQNLVERRGGLESSRYTLHSLTLTFVQTNVLRQRGQ
jgi:hypothetical protein